MDEPENENDEEAIELQIYVMFVVIILEFMVSVCSTISKWKIPNSIRQAKFGAFLKKAPYFRTTIFLDTAEISIINISSKVFDFGETNVFIIQRPLL